MRANGSSYLAKLVTFLVVHVSAYLLVARCSEFSNAAQHHGGENLDTVALLIEELRELVVENGIDPRELDVQAILEDQGLDEEQLEDLHETLASSMETLLSSENLNQNIDSSAAEETEDRSTLTGGDGTDSSGTADLTTDEFRQVEIPISGDATSLSSVLGNMLGDISSGLSQGGETLANMLTGAVTTLSPSVVTISSSSKSVAKVEMDTFTGCVWPYFKPIGGTRRPLRNVMEEAKILSLNKNNIAERNKSLGSSFRNSSPVVQDSQSHNLLSWIRDGGGTVNSLGIRKHPWGREVFATEPIQSRTIVGSIPRSHLMRTAAAFKSSNAAKKISSISVKNLSKDQKDKIMIAILILEQIGTKHGIQGGDLNTQDVFFGPYLEMMPLTLPHMPIFWSMKDLVSLEGMSTWFNVMQQRRVLQQEWRLVRSIVPEFAAKFSFNDFVWSRAIVMTRAFRVRFDFGSPNSPSKIHMRLQQQSKRRESWHQRDFRDNVKDLSSLYFSRASSHLAGGEPTPLEHILSKVPVKSEQRKICHNDVLVMAPLADMLNHHLSPNTAWRYSSSLDSFTLVATKDIKAGDPVLDSYGVKPNDALLRTFGFVDTDFSQVLRQHRVATAKLEVVRSDFLWYCPRPRKSSDGWHTQRECPKMNPRDALMVFLGRVSPMSHRQYSSKYSNPLRTFTISQSLEKDTVSLFKYFSIDGNHGERDGSVALITRLEREFQDDEERACRVGACDLWKHQSDYSLNKDASAAASQKPLMEVFETEWKWVISHPTLTDNQRNGFLSRVEERAAFRYLLRVAYDSLLATGAAEESDDEAFAEYEANRLLRRRLRQVGNLSWTLNDTKTLNYVNSTDFTDSEENTLDHDQEQIHDQSNEQDEETRKKYMAAELAVEAAVQAELVEQEALAEIAAEVGAVESELDEETSRGGTNSGETIEYSPSQSIVIELSGVGGQTIRFSLPASISQTRNLEANAPYEIINEALHLMRSGLTTREDAASPKTGDLVLAKASDSNLFFSGTVISTMDDGSHIVKFDVYPTKAFAKIHGWYGPAGADENVFYNIAPKDIIKISPTSKYNRRKHPDETGSSIHAATIPTAWRLLDRELLETKLEGSEVFVHWAQNEAKMHFDGIITDTYVETSNGISEWKASIQYNDGDFEQGVKADHIFVRTF